MNFKFDNKNNTIIFSVDKNIYSPDVILAVAYLFIDRAYIFLDTTKDKIIVSIKGKKKLNNKGLQDIVNEFNNELINQTLRIKVAKENKKIREYIISQALCSTVGIEESLPSTQLPEGEVIKEEDIDEELEKILKEIEDETEPPSYKEDPLGIAIPWEKKYGKKKG